MSIIAKNIPVYIKNSDFPLTKLNLQKFDGIQKGIPLFNGVKPDDIAFITKKFETLNLFRGCSSGCTHCLKDAKPINRGTILYDDLLKFLDGFNKLSERLGVNVFQGNKYVSLTDDANPSDIPIMGKDGMHSLVEAIKIIYEKIHLPSLIVTSGWNRTSKYAQSTSEKLATLADKNPETISAINISINPFSEIMEKSRNALKNSNQSSAEFFRNIYTDRMANALKVFLRLFETGKASVIYRHAPDYKGNEPVGEIETRKLYEEIYSKLKKITGSALDNIPELKPENLTRFDRSHLIEPSGRARRYFPLNKNLAQQQKLIDEILSFENLPPDVKQKILLDCALKCVDINGQVYATMPSVSVETFSAPVEITVPANIRLNYENKKAVPPVFSDI